MYIKKRKAWNNQESRNFTKRDDRALMKYDLLPWSVVTLIQTGLQQILNQRKSSFVTEKINFYSKQIKFCNLNQMQNQIL